MFSFLSFEVIIILETKVYVDGLVYHLFNKILISAYNVLDFVLHGKRCERKETHRWGKRKIRKREVTPRQTRKSGKFLKRGEEQ